MKNKIIILTLLALFLCSCNKENYDLIENIPEIEGSWEWHSTVVGGAVGIWNTSHYDLDCTLIFEKDNLMSIMDGDEYVICQEKFNVKIPNNIPCIPNTDTPVGDYLIELPNKVQKAIKEYFAAYEIFVDGYISVSNSPIEGYSTMLNIRSTNKDDIENGVGSHYVR